MVKLVYAEGNNSFLVKDWYWLKNIIYSSCYVVSLFSKHDVEVTIAATLVFLTLQNGGVGVLSDWNL